MLVVCAGKPVISQQPQFQEAQEKGLAFAPSVLSSKEVSRNCEPKCLFRLAGWGALNIQTEPCGRSGGTELSLHFPQGNERQGSDERDGLALGSMHHLQRQDH